MKVRTCRGSPTWASQKPRTAERRGTGFGGGGQGQRARLGSAPCAGSPTRRGRRLDPRGNREAAPGGAAQPDGQGSRSAQPRRRRQPPHSVARRGDAERRASVHRSSRSVQSHGRVTCPFHRNESVPAGAVAGAAGSRCPAADAGRWSTGTQTRFLPRLCMAGAQGAAGGPGGPHPTPGTGPSRKRPSAAGGLSPVEETPAQRGRCRAQKPGDQGLPPKAPPSRPSRDWLQRPPPPPRARVRAPRTSRQHRTQWPSSRRLTPGSSVPHAPGKAKVGRPIARGLVLPQLRRKRRGKQK